HGGHGHGSGHEGGAWIITYCDMITLLIAFFICIVTFSSRESGNQKYAKMRDSVLYGEGGTGTAGDPVKGADQDAVLWRQVLISASRGSNGSRVPPRYSNPSLNATQKVLGMMEEPTVGTLADSYSLRMPLTLLFDSAGQLTPTGRALLSA